MANIAKSAPLRDDKFWLGSKIKNDGLDVGMYKALSHKGQTVSMHLEELKSEVEGKETPYLGLTFPEIYALRKALKKENKPVPPTAFETCIKQAGIAAWGQHTDMASKFFEYSDVSVLFPEFFSNQVYAGMLKNSIIGEFILAENVVSAIDFHKIYLDDVEADRQLADVAPLQDLPVTKIRVSEQSVYLTKYGLYLLISWDDLKYQRLNLFGRALERIGQQIDIDMSDEMVYILINGDGNSNTPGTTVQSITSGSIVTQDVIAWATGLPTPYKCKKFIGKKALLQEYYLVLADFNNPMATFGFMGIDIPRAFEWDRSVVTTDYFIGVDNDYAVEKITTGAVNVQSEEIVRQMGRGTAIYHDTSFSVYDKNAVQLFDETH